MITKDKLSFIQNKNYFYSNKMDQKQLQKWKYPIILLPNLISWGIFFLTRDSYDDKNKTTKPWFSPPRMTFFFVWFILFGYTGYYLYRSLKEKSEQFKKLRNSIILLLSVAYLWMLVFGYSTKKNAILLFIPLISFALSCEIQIYYLFDMPFFLFTAWSIFAFVLSAFDK
jgi:tryptophan-rich sensory protein